MRQLWIVLTIIDILILFTGCNTCSCRSRIESPKLPIETRETIYIYSPKPLIVAFSEFHRQLNQFAYQLTLLYIVDSDRWCNIENLRCLTKLQREFYRYGVRVIVADFREPNKNWHKLRSLLYKAHANYLAEYLIGEQQKLLKDFIGFEFNVNRLFIIDLTKEKHIIRVYDLTCDKISNKIRTILSKRTKGSSLS